MGLLQRLVRQCTESLGVRIVRASQLPRGIDPALYADVRKAQSGAPVMFDVGAHAGDTAAELLAIFPNGKVQAFEPSPLTFPKLKQRWGGHAQVVCHNAAVGAAAGELPFEVRADDSYLSRLATEESANTVRVPVTTVDSEAQRLGVDRIALLKSDTEGHELNVLQGAQRMLSEGRIHALIIEATPGAATHRHVSVADLSAHLTPFGYELFGLYDFGYRANGALRYCNALFKHASVLSGR